VSAALTREPKQTDVAKSPGYSSEEVSVRWPGAEGVPVRAGTEMTE